MKQPIAPSAVPPEAIWRVLEVWGRVPGAHAAALEKLAAQGWEVHHTCWVRPLQHGAPRMAFVVAWRVEAGARP